MSETREDTLPDTQSGILIRYPLVKSLSERDLRFIALILEFEGSICLSKTRRFPRLQIEIKVTEKTILDAFQTLVGFGKIKGPYKNNSPFSNKPLWKWFVSAGLGPRSGWVQNQKLALTLYKDIEPYLVTKRVQLDE